MRICRQYDIRDNKLGIPTAEAMDVEIEAHVEYDNGEPYTVVDGVYMYHENLFHGDIVSRHIAAAIVVMAEDDDSVLMQLLGIDDGPVPRRTSSAAWA